MAVAITTASRRRHRQDDPFALYVVDSEGPPLVHVSRTRRSEIVVFGRQQKLLPPIVLDTGSIFLNAAENDDKIELSKIVPSRFGDADVKITTTLELAEVVRKTASLGATYPQIVAILETAKRQKKSGRRARRRRGAQFQSGLPRSRPGQGHDRQARRLPSSGPPANLPSQAGAGCSESSDRDTDPPSRTTPRRQYQARMHPSSRPEIRPTGSGDSGPDDRFRPDAVAMLKKAATQRVDRPPRRTTRFRKPRSTRRPPPRRRLFDFFRRERRILNRSDRWVVQSDLRSKSNANLRIGMRNRTIDRSENRNRAFSETPARASRGTMHTHSCLSVTMTSLSREMAHICLILQLRRNSYGQQGLHKPDSPEDRLAWWGYPWPLLKSHAARFEY